MGKVESIQFVERLAQFVRPRGAGDVVTDNAAKGVRLDRRQLLEQVLNQGAANGRERVSVVEAEGREPVTLAADVENLAQGEFTFPGGFPKFVGGSAAFRSGFMQGVLFLAQTGVDGDDRFPRRNLSASAVSFRFAGRLATEIGFDLLQRGHTLALEVAATSLGKQRFGGEAILDTQRFPHRRLQIHLHLTGSCHVKPIPPKADPINPAS